MNPQRGFESLKMSFSSTSTCFYPLRQVAFRMPMLSLVGSRNCSFLLFFWKTDVTAVGDDGGTAEEVFNADEEAFGTATFYFY